VNTVELFASKPRAAAPASRDVRRPVHLLVRMFCRIGRIRFMMVMSAPLMSPQQEIDMSKRNWFVGSIPSIAVALTSVLLAPGCEGNETEPRPASVSPAASATAMPKAPLSGVAARRRAPPAKGGAAVTEIKIGQTMPYSGPASAYSVIGKTQQGFIKMINEKGGVNGRKINLISVDDGYSPPKALEQARKLVEAEGVLFIFNPLGTPSNTAMQKYLNDKKVPQLFVATGADKFSDPKNHPWTMAWQPSYRLEAKAYTQYLLKEKPNAKLCVLYQNDDFGKDYLIGLKEGFGAKHDKIVIKTASYEITDPSVDSQIVSLQAAGCDTLLTAATPRTAAQTIRKIFDIGWKPLHLLSNTSVSQAAVLKPAGLEKSVGIITAGYLLDPSNPDSDQYQGMKDYKAFMKQYLPDMDPLDGNSLYAYGVSLGLVQVLKQCGNDLSRENIMKQAQNLKKFVVSVTTPGIEVNTSATDYRPFSQVRLARFNGKFFEQFSDVMSVDL
jgi:branched-chain amino acid transport system substrate-binding protein